MIRIKEIDKQITGDRQRVIYHLSASRNVWLTDNKLVLEYPAKYELSNLGEAGVFSLLPIAYMNKESISLPDNIQIERSTRERITEICTRWNRLYELNRYVHVLSTDFTEKREKMLNRKTAHLFSGGLDSMATFARNISNVDYLIFIRGADIPVNNLNKYKQIYEVISNFSRLQNKKLITIMTNVHDLSDVSWLNISYGCGQLGPLCALSRYIKRIYISASHTKEYAKTIPNGSHPDTDPFIRTGITEVVHDSFELNRPEKAKLVSKHPQMLKYLKVCNEPINKKINCSDCEKCFRTSMAFKVTNSVMKELPFDDIAYDY
jgi:hypothetical protein